MTTLARCLRSTLLLVLTSPLALAGDVHVVDVFGGGDFTQIDAAVSFAASGDTILVKQGTYIGFTISGKSLVVTADRNAVVFINGQVAVQDLAANQSVVVHGLQAETLTNGPGITVSSCAGPVWVEDGSFAGPVLPQFSDPGAVVSGSAAVSFHRVGLEGARALGDDAGEGLLSTASAVYLFDCDVVGGLGNAGAGGLLAGAGVHASDSVFYAAGGSLVGGGGGPGSSPFGCADGGPGGTGLVLAGGSSAAQLLGVAPQGGAPGTSALPCSDGTAGADVDLGAGLLLEQPFTARSLSADGPVRAGQLLTITVGGVPGDLVLLVVARIQRPLFVEPTAFPMNPLLGGPLLPSATAPLLLEFGAIGPSGSLQSFIVAPDFPGEATTLYSQAVVVAPSAAGEVVFSAAQTLTFLDASF